MSTTLIWGGGKLLKGMCIMWDLFFFCPRDFAPIAWIVSSNNTEQFLNV